MRVGVSNRYKILITIVTLILIYYAYKSFKDYSSQVIHEVSCRDFVNEWKKIVTELYHLQLCKF